MYRRTIKTLTMLGLSCILLATNVSAGPNDYVSRELQADMCRALVKLGYLDDFSGFNSRSDSMRMSRAIAKFRKANGMPREAYKKGFPTETNYEAIMAAAKDAPDRSQGE